MDPFSRVSTKYVYKQSILPERERERGAHPPPLHPPSGEIERGIIEKEGEKEEEKEEEKEDVGRCFRRTRVLTECL